METKDAQAILDKIIGQIFGYQNPLSLQKFQEKYAFDVRLPQQVVDTTTGQPTWSQSVNAAKFITVENAWKREDWDALPKRALNNMQDILQAWDEINYTSTERQIDSLAVAESDNIYSSENIYRSQDIRGSKHILFSDGLNDCEYIAAGQRSNGLSFCARTDDSTGCSNSFAVTWSKKIVNSLFIEDCSDLYECMFCSHVANKKFCIANAQYTEEEYRRIKDMVVRWLLAA